MDDPHPPTMSKPRKYVKIILEKRNEENSNMCGPLL